MVIARSLLYSVCAVFGSASDPSAAADPNVNRRGRSVQRQFSGLALRLPFLGICSFNISSLSLLVNCLRLIALNWKRTSPEQTWPCQVAFPCQHINPAPSHTTLTLLAEFNENLHETKSLFTCLPVPLCRTICQFDAALKSYYLPLVQNKYRKQWPLLMDIWIYSPKHSQKEQIKA